MGRLDVPREKPSRDGLKFLIVDADSYYASQLKKLILKATGQRGGVHLVPGIDGALKLLDEQTFDVCFLDFDLADQVGLERDQISRLFKPLTAVIFVSEKPSKASALRALNIGAKDFLIKSNVSDFDVAKSISYALFWEYREIEREADARRKKPLGSAVAPFDEHLVHALDVAKRGKEKVGLLMIELSGIGPVVEDYGDDVSEKLLDQVAQRISNKVSSSDMVSRLNETEFGTILVKVPSQGVVNTISGTLVDEIAEKPYHVDGYALKIGAAIGASTYPDDADNLDDLKAIAQDALELKTRQKREQTTIKSHNYFRL